MLHNLLQRQAVETKASSFRKLHRANRPEISWLDQKGKPIVENTHSCRCECLALISLLRSKGNGWYIAEHRDEHNHSLSLTYGQTLHWSSHKHIDGYSRDIMKQLRQNNMNLAKVYNIIGTFLVGWKMYLSLKERCEICLVKSDANEQKMMSEKQSRTLFQGPAVRLSSSS